MTSDLNLCPADTADLIDLVAQAAASGSALELRGGGSKQEIGRPDRGAATVDLKAFRGVVDYEPSELVLTVRPATPLAEVESLLDAHGQMLAFEPWDHGPLFGRTKGSATIGGVVVAGVAGPRRLSAGGARDHILGFSAVSGRAEAFKAGGKVVKNVTGYDLSKVIAGSWGQLATLTELSLKVVPKPRCVATLAAIGLSPQAAIEAMAFAMGSRTAPVAAAHIPAGAGSAMTLLRLEGIAESVAVRSGQLTSMLGKKAEVLRFDDTTASQLWADVREAAALSSAEALWRVQLAPSRAASFADALAASGSQWLFDWAGALVWVGAPASFDLRPLAKLHGGHAMLKRAPREMRRTIPIKHPEAPTVAALTERVKRAFDPAGILDPARFG